MTEHRIPFNRVSIAGDELRYVARAIESGHTSAGGPFSRACADRLEQRLGVPRVLLTTSCTHALEMSAELLCVGPGDEVIVPAFAFVSTAGAFANHGARPVFVDVRPDTLNLDERLVADRITSRTKAIVALHYAGVGCEMDDLMEISERTGIPIIEDAAHGLLGGYRGRKLATFGPMAALSFHETKNLTCGEGGALVINDRALEERAQVVHNVGTDRHRFARGLVNRYTWVDHGSSYGPSDILAAFLLAQIEHLDRIQLRRREIWERYDRELAGWARSMGVRVPSVPAHCEQPYHLYYLVLPSPGLRNRFIEFLGARAIMCVFHYQPLHLSKMGLMRGGQPGDCPVAEEAGACLVRLPFHNGLSPADQAHVIAAVQDFDCHSEAA